jgi:predicted NAD/FAD-dependent oxidoreductase
VSEAPVVVVGGGISGISCARVLADAGHNVRVLDRGRRLGGRMAVRTEQLGDADHPVDHAVDIGASHFTVRDERFAAVVTAWQDAGLARIWTDTFDTRGAGGPVGTTTSGQQRWSAPHGLRSLVEQLAEGLDVTIGHVVERVDLDAGGRVTVDGEQVAAVVLAMPDPQAARLLPRAVSATLGLRTAADWAPVIAVWAAWAERWWGAWDGTFVDGSDVLTWIADDGRRRGDDAPVLVAHTAPAFAAGRLDDPASAVPVVLEELRRVLDVDVLPEPQLARSHRWSLAAPRHLHEAPFGLHPALIGVCGDAWGEQSRIEQAFCSGHALGTALTARLAA